MKSLLVLTRIIIVGCLWSIVFIEGIRVIMLCNWHFDILWPDHWRQAYALWKAGWVIKAPKEWAFVIIIATFFPMLITGWWTLSLVAWEKIFYDILTFPVKLYHKFIKAPINVITTNNKYGVVKKKSYKQIRPAGVGSSRAPISDYGEASKSPIQPMHTPISQGIQPMSASAATSRVTSKLKKTDIPSAIDHALFKFDDDDDDDFDLDFDSFEKTNVSKKETNKDDNKNNKSDNEDKKQTKKEVSEENKDDSSKNSPKNKKQKDKNINKEKESQDKSQNREREKEKSKNEPNKNSDNSSKGPVFDALLQKGYEVISGTSVKGTVVDFIGISENQICLCLVDKEPGDWLADEELFNGEEPLWFSENSHRISPVRKLDVARNLIKDKLEKEGFEQDIHAFVVIQMANIINADDMFDIWNDLNIDVTRINRGSPKEIRLFSKTLTESDGDANKDDIEKIRKILKNIK